MSPHLLALESISLKRVGIFPSLQSFCLSDPLPERFNEWLSAKIDHHLRALRVLASFSPLHCHAGNFVHDDSNMTLAKIYRHAQMLSWTCSRNGMTVMTVKLRHLKIDEPKRLRLSFAEPDELLFQLRRSLHFWVEQLLARVRFEV